MKYLFAAVLALGTVASFSAAEAAGGCGPGWHRGPYGGCQPNRRRCGGGAGVVVAPGRGGAPRSRLPLRHRVALWPLPRLLIFPKHDKSPARAGLFLFLAQTILAQQSWRLTSSNDDDASSGGANDGGDASPNAGDASGGGPSAGDASPSAFGPSRDDGRGPSALLPA